MNGADVASNDPEKWVGVYLSGTGGTNQGVQYNTQTPTLPFLAKYHVRWKANNTFTNALTWNGSSWVDAGWDFTGAVFQSGNYIEMRIARSNIGSPGQVSVDVDMLNETNGVEATYAGLPDNAFADGFNPMPAHYFNFDLNGCESPSMFTPI